MKLLKGGNLAKLVAFFVIAAVLTCTVAFASGGWQSFTEDDPDSDDAAGGNATDGEVDENTDGKNGEDASSPAPIPKFTHYLTGLTVTPEEAVKRPLAFVYSHTDPLYAVSSSMLTVEIPTENGSTRLLAFISGSEYLGKIGSICPTRGYMSAVVDGLGATLIHRGIDDSFEYETTDYDEGLDLTVHTGYSYTEYTDYHYTNGDLVSALLKNSCTSTVINEPASLPFRFVEEGAAPIKGTSIATSVMIPYSDTNVTQLVYDANSAKYILHKNSSALKDLLNDKVCSYDNVFVLYASSTTYETLDATETVIDTTSGGVGYYFTMGTVVRISWSTDEAGCLVFFTEGGTRLTVNPGTSYIAFEKASRINQTTYN